MKNPEYNRDIEEVPKWKDFKIRMFVKILMAYFKL